MQLLPIRKDGCAPLTVAALCANNQIVDQMAESLLDYHVHIHVRDSAMHDAILVYYGDKEIARLFQRGATVDEKNNFYIALMFAASHGRKQLVLILENGANEHAIKESGNDVQNL